MTGDFCQSRTHKKDTWLSTLSKELRDLGQEDSERRKLQWSASRFKDEMRLQRQK